MVSSPVVLCVMDGVGWGRRDAGDAVHLASMPHLDRMMSQQSWCLLKAHGTAVGLPSDSDMGNSEVGHNAMGAGRTFDQGSKLVGQAIESGRIWRSAAWQSATATETLHFIGLLSDGGVHSHVNHLHAMIKQAVKDGVGCIRVHLLTDGRDVPGRSALDFIKPLEALLHGLPADCAIATGGGRMRFTMDRYEADWSMVERGWALQVHAQGRRFPSASTAVQTLYAEDADIDDQYLPSFVVGDFGGIQDGDGVLMFNFRGDRAMEICQAFEADDFAHFDRGCRPQVFFAGMMQYDGDLHIPRNFLVEPPCIDNTVSHFMGEAGLKTLAISETQKFGHVTYFFNGNRGECPAGEDWVEVPSLSGPLDQAPQMMAREITQGAVRGIQSGGYDHIRLNLANGDMVGHTGDMAATIRAMEIIDECLGRLAEATAQAGGVLFVTADHGNADQMYQVDKHTGAYAVDGRGRLEIRPSHSLNPVPFVLHDCSGRWQLNESSRHGSGLAQIGSSLLQVTGVAIPDQFQPSLIQDRQTEGS
jgi:2,3-bisphosphoglycerate-independent phosphoglycerate mutase